MSRQLTCLLVFRSVIDIYSYFPSSRGRDSLPISFILSLYHLLMVHIPPRCGSKPTIALSPQTRCSDIAEFRRYASVRGTRSPPSRRYRPVDSTQPAHHSGHAAAVSRSLVRHARRPRLSPLGAAVIPSIAPCRSPPRSSIIYPAAVLARFRAHLARGAEARQRPDVAIRPLRLMCRRVKCPSQVPTRSSGPPRGGTGPQRAALPPSAASFAPGGQFPVDGCSLWTFP